MSNVRNRCPALLWVLVALLLVQALGGIAGGAALVKAPDGSNMKMSTSLLDGSPFSDYLIPGLVLLLVLGVLPLAAAVLLLVWPRAGWYAAFVVGCGLVIWLAVELTIILQKVLRGAGGQSLLLPVSVGVVITALLSRIPVPGGILLLVMAVPGTGALVLSYAQYRRARRQSAVPAGASMDRQAAV
jgi:hypothetical protein